jgi:hypothetical protein
MGPLFIIYIYNFYFFIFFHEIFLLIGALDLSICFIFQVSGIFMGIYLCFLVEALRKGLFRLMRRLTLDISITCKAQLLLCKI